MPANDVTVTWLASYTVATPVKLEFNNTHSTGFSAADYTCGNTATPNVAGYHVRVHAPAQASL